MKHYKPLLISLAFAYGVGFVGSLITMSAVDTWYADLMKPYINPPDWVFGLVWTILYAVMAFAAWRIWEAHKKRGQRGEALIVYGIHLVINLFWSIAFFILKDFLLALAIIIFLVTFIAALIVLFYHIDRLAGLLLIPYFLWVCFVAYLNLMIVLLN